MYFIKSFLVLASIAFLVSAVPGVDKRISSGLLVRQNSPATGNNCNSYIGDCYQNGCVGTFASPSDTLGYCSSGNYDGCPCNKCGSGSNYEGDCSANGCQGVGGTCTAGDFQGCPCTGASSNYYYPPSGYNYDNQPGGTQPGGTDQLYSQQATQPGGTYQYSQQAGGTQPGGTSQVYSQPAGALVGTQMEGTQVQR